MPEREARARIKINKLLEEAGWCFEPTPTQPANILLEPGINYKTLGDDFEHAITRNKVRGAIDFLLLDKDKFPLVVVEAKKETIDPLSAKEQARAYAKTVKARYVILTNGNIHYLWDTEYGSPQAIIRFPSQDSLTQAKAYIPSPQDLANAIIHENYIIESQMFDYKKDPAFRNLHTRDQFLKDHNLKELRPYQVGAVQALQESARQGSTRFLFEMATGTGKTLVSAAVIKLFLKTGNAHRVLFLVDRLELETQAYKAFVQYLGRDFTSMIYKENTASWHSAMIVVSTIQTFLSGDRYRKEFSPTDFDLVISDEAHRSIGGNSRAVFEYFTGYKLGLTATPKDYLKGLDQIESGTQREFERRLLLDTYKTFGCESGSPTFRYDLLAGVRDGYLINPIIVDARTDITTQLLSEEGYAVHQTTEDGEEIEFSATERHYEKKIYNEETNLAMCRVLLDNGLFDPVTNNLGIPLFGKTIVFCVSQHHASKITQMLNQLALKKWPEHYRESDFAMQVTSVVQDAQQMTINFSNNRLGGMVKNPPGYESGKTRVCVTVGMMTTGYDCPDILNLGLMRPIFSPSEFVQIKGRGTRKHSFTYQDFDTKETYTEPKEHYKLFDFFATCEYFEHDFNYNEKIKVPRSSIPTSPPLGDGSDRDYGNPPSDPLDLQSKDDIKTCVETYVSEQGMRIDRELFKQAIQEDVLTHAALLALWKNGEIKEAEEYTRANILDKPKYHLTLEKIRKAFHIDRRITIREFLEVAFGDKDTFAMKEELLESEWLKFVVVNPVSQEYYAYAKSFFKAYLTDATVRSIIESKQFGKLGVSGSFDFEEYKLLGVYKTLIPSYIKDYIPLSPFTE